MASRRRARALHPFLGAMLGSLAACGVTASPDAGGRDTPIGSGEACAGERWLDVGRCVRPSGASCLSGPGEPSDQRRFEPLTEGATVAVTIGHQGSSMLALAARTRGIAPGDPAHPSDTGNPRVVLLLRGTDGTELALYRGRCAFVPDPSEPGRLVCDDLPLIVDGVAVSGPVRVEASLRDANGVERCGAIGLVVTP